MRWNRLGWLHIPCVLWVIWIETSANICPLTPLENELRAKAGLATYEGGFVDHYIMPVLYPEDLTRRMQIGIAVGLVTINLVSYGLIFFLRRRRRLRARQAASALPPATATEAAPAADPSPAPLTPDNADPIAALPHGR